MTVAQPEAHASLPSRPLKIGHTSAKRRTSDIAARVLVTLAAVVAVIPLGWMVYTLFARGLGQIVNVDWWTKSQVYGGAANAIVGTLIQTAIAAAISIPLGILVGVYLIEYANERSRLTKVTTFMVDVLAGVPSIVAALFVYAVWRTTFGMSQSGFAVALALVLLMLPLVVRSTEEMLKIVPQDLREASYALGVPKWKTIIAIVIPTALSGIITGVMLAVARVMGEAAPVLILVGATKMMNSDPFAGPQQSLPLMMFGQYKLGQSGYDYVWGAALTLVILVGIVYVTARVIAANTGVNKKRK